MDSKLTVDSVNLYLHNRLQEDISRIYPLTHAIETSTDTETEKPKEIVLVYRQYKRNTPTAEQIASDKAYLDSIDPTRITLKTRNKSTDKELAIKHLQESNSRTAKETIGDIIIVDADSYDLYNRAYELVCSVLKSTETAPPKKRSASQRTIASDLRDEVNKSLCKSLTGKCRKQGDAYVTNKSEVLAYLNASGLNVDDLFQEAITILLETGERKIAQNAVSAYIRAHAKRIDGKHLYIEECENFGDMIRTVDTTAELQKIVDDDAVNSIFREITKGIKKINIALLIDYAKDYTYEEIGKRHKIQKKGKRIPMPSENVRSRINETKKKILQNIQAKTGATTKKECYQALKQALANGTF